MLLETAEYYEIKEQMGCHHSLAVKLLIWLACRYPVGIFTAVLKDFPSA